MTASYPMSGAASDDIIDLHRKLYQSTLQDRQGLLCLLVVEESLRDVRVAKMRMPRGLYFMFEKILTLLSNAVAPDPCFPQIKTVIGNAQLLDKRFKDY